MKKLLILLTLTITTALQAQAPQGFNYQATVRNSAGDLIVNTNVYFKFNVIQGSETAVPIFTETHYVPTDDLGQVNLVIGEGTANTGTFSELDWSLGSYYLGIELDTGSGYVAMGTTQLLSVPYALYAENSGNSTPTTPTLQSVLAENNSAGQQQIKDLLEPTDGADAVTKSYVDALSNTQGLMNFNGWDNYQVWDDGTSVQLTPNSFVFVNANDTTLVFPDSPENCCFGDVIYVYVMEGDPLNTAILNLQANGFPVAVGGGYMPFEFTSSGTIVGWFNSGGLKTIVNVGDYWMVADFQGQIITDSDIDDDGDGFTENQGDCDDTNATIYPPVIPSQEITICSGDTFVFDPVNNPPTTLVPEGTTYTWTVTDALGEIVGESSTTSSQSQISQTLNNYGGAFYGISYEVTPYSPSGCQGQTFELIVYVTLPTVIYSIDDMVLMDGEYRFTDISSYSVNNNAIVTYDWVSDIDFGAGLSGEGDTLDFIATNSSSNPITANVIVSATDTTYGVTCESPPETFTITVNPAEGSVTDQDGNTYDILTYGNQVWTVENAEMVTYRDGTPIPQVTDQTQWSNLSTGAWAYYDNDPTKPRLYNWYAVAGIHDTDPNTPNKEFAPEGWHVPTDAEWTTLEEYLIANGYNYDESTTGNKLAKTIASNTGWNSSTNEGAPGNDQSLNNSSGFNAFPDGNRYNYGPFTATGVFAIFWTSTETSSDYAWFRILYNSDSSVDRYGGNFKKDGMSVRLVKD